MDIVIIDLDSKIRTIKNKAFQEEIFCSESMSVLNKHKLIITLHIFPRKYFSSSTFSFHLHYAPKGNCYLFSN